MFMRNTYQKGNSTVLSIIGVILLIGVIALVAGTVFKSKEWIGLYNTPDAAMPRMIGFRDKEECLDWLYDQQLNPGERTNFECGLNCKLGDSVGVLRCEETAD